MMKRFIRQSDRKTTPDLSRVIEPLAGYICAADRPRETLLSALAVLFDEMDETNRAAMLYFSRLRGYTLETVA